MRSRWFFVCLALAALTVACGPASGSPSGERAAGSPGEPGGPGGTGGASPPGSVGGTAGTAGAPSPPSGGAGGSGGTGFSGAGGGGTVGSGGECHDVVDVVFVLDVSSSMAFALTKLRDEIDVVVQAAAQLAPEPHFGLVAFVDNHRLDLGGPGGTAVHLDGTTLVTAFDFYFQSYMLFDRNPGDDPLLGSTQQNPICEENSLDALHAAATEFPWRDNATRVVIVTTDDTFLEAPDNYGDRDGDGLTNQTDFPKEGHYPALRTYDETVAALVAADARVFSFTKVAPPAPFDPFVCGTGRRRPLSEVPHGWSMPHQGKAAIPMATDGASFDLNLVQANQLSLAATISQVVVDSYCRPPVH